MTRQSQAGDAAGRPGRDHEAYVQRALAACVEQGFSVAIEDPATLDFLADVLGSAPAPAVTDGST